MISSSDKICSSHSQRTGKRCTLPTNHPSRHEHNQSCICGGRYCSGVPRRIEKGTHPIFPKLKSWATGDALVLALYLEEDV